MILLAILQVASAQDALADLAGQPPAEVPWRQPQVIAYDRPQVIPDEAATAYVQVNGEPVICQLQVAITDTGEVAHVSAGDCPNSLLASARQGLWSWSFHPPSLGGRAVDATHSVTLEYRANTVVTPTPSTDDYMLVRVAPAAVPRWPVELAQARWAQRYLEDRGLDAVTCEATISLGRSGSLDRFEATDCPAELADNLERLAHRWGFDVIGQGEELRRFQLSMTFENNM